MAELAARSPVPLRHVWQPDDGFRLAESRNNGILAATGDYIITLDGDCVPQRDFIAAHRKLAEPGYMVTGSRILLSQAFSARVLAEGIDLQSLTLADKLRYRLQGAWARRRSCCSSCRTSAAAATASASAASRAATWPSGAATWNA
ncbi:glycosyltransferase [Massilia sp. Dwa41.01b]|uniref:glycosyltransferase n=1 Tax=Massilia sp. Dwa41.01b TaxID=2709302 RepID=UPI0022772AAA|nr:glycosyltransferase [Massilia sp. Dwa41.01b]